MDYIGDKTYDISVSYLQKELKIVQDTIKNQYLNKVVKNLNKIL